MPSRSSTGTKNAIYYVENETMRGLMSIISQVGLSLGKLLSMKDTFVTAIVFHLERNTLSSVRLEFLDTRGNVIANGFGLWEFKVSYGSSGNSIIEFPVQKVLSELRSNPYALQAAVDYAVTLMIPPGSELPPGWNWTSEKYHSSSQSKHIASFGYDPLNVSVHRE